MYDVRLLFHAYISVTKSARSKSENLFEIQTRPPPYTNQLIEGIYSNETLRTSVTCEEGLSVELVINIGPNDITRLS